MQKGWIALTIFMLLSAVTYGQTNYFRFGGDLEWNTPFPVGVKKITKFLVRDSVVKDYDEFTYDREGRLTQLTNFLLSLDSAKMYIYKVYSYTYQEGQLKKRTQVSPTDPSCGKGCEVRYFYKSNDHYPDSSLQQAENTFEKTNYEYDQRYNLLKTSHSFFHDSNSGRELYGCHKYEYNKKGFYKRWFGYGREVTPTLKLFWQAKYKYKYYSNGHLKQQKMVYEISYQRRVRGIQHIMTYNKKGEITSHIFPGQDYYYTYKYEYY